METGTVDLAAEDPQAFLTRELSIRIAANRTGCITLRDRNMTNRPTTFNRAVRIRSGI
jgi:hypothetical protein